MESHVLSPLSLVLWSVWVNGSQACTIDHQGAAFPPSVLIKWREWQINKVQSHSQGSQPFVLSIVMLPFPPSVLILVLPITGLPEKDEVPRISGGFFGGARSLWLMSCRVTSPSFQDGLMRLKGYATVVVMFCFTLTSDELPPSKPAEPNDQRS